jgi:flagellar basal body-associated protein FliL
MKLFNRKEETELTEEQKKELEEKKAKRKEVIWNGVKIVVGVVAFGVGMLLVAAAMNVETDESDTVSLPEPQEPMMLPEPEEVIEEEKELVTDSVEA